MTGQEKDCSLGGTGECAVCDGTGRIDDNGQSAAFGWPTGWRCKRCDGTGSSPENVEEET